MIENSIDIECDGRMIKSDQDPPGQKCVYIIPGDTAKETYRLSTFQYFPENIPVDPCKLAAIGFYYSGYKDRVKCFSCGCSVDNWTLKDDPLSPHWHDKFCDLMNGSDERNIPILAFLRHQQTLISQRCASTSNKKKKTTSIISQTTSNALPAVSSSNFNSSTKSATNKPNVSANILSDPNFVCETNKQEQRRVFPCLSPINPHMRRKEARMQTFLDHSAKWPAHKIQASPQNIADTGMFYLGERDRVKCWYCNGGLQNWEKNDLPWEEHAKWFPLCEFVLQQKGLKFVETIVMRNPNLRRPNLRNPSSSSHACQIARMINQSQTNREEIAPHPILVDPRQELRKRHQAVDEALTSSPLVLDAKLMGFDDKEIRTALTRKFETDESGFSNLHDLIEMILSISTDDQKNLFGKSLSENVSSISKSNNSLQNEMKRLEESKQCRVCRKCDACMVLTPCCHLCCCENCGSTVKKCPICQETIEERIRSYVS